MKFKKIFLAILIIATILTITAVSASDVNQTQIAQDSSLDKIAEYTQNQVLESEDSPKENVNIKVNYASGTQWQKTKLTATAKTDSGKSISNVEITFKVNGKTYTAQTNSKGIATVEIKIPASAKFKTTKKTSGDILTKKTTYKKTYSCKASTKEDSMYLSGETTFKITSKKKTEVEKFKIIKTKKIETIPAKKGDNRYLRGQLGVITSRYRDGKISKMDVLAASKLKGFITFFIRSHYKKDGKWQWGEWIKVPKGNYYTFSYGDAITFDKMQVRYTHISHKKIN